MKPKPRRGDMINLRSLFSVRQMGSFHHIVANRAWGQDFAWIFYSSTPPRLSIPAIQMHHLPVPDTRFRFVHTKASFVLYNFTIQYSIYNLHVPGIHDAVVIHIHHHDVDRFTAQMPARGRCSEQCQYLIVPLRPLTADDQQVIIIAFGFKACFQLCVITDRHRIYIFEWIAIQ